ncbi:MAG: cohesin domain-containing protein, partial [Saprospiraceae bacterium]|nr:cohesin domain-containing protein [Saprospiraceae bacterium]
MSRKFLAVIMGLFFAALTLKAQPQFTISNTSADNGSTVDINVTVDDYTDYISLQFSVNWDPSILAFLDVTDLTDGLPGFSVASSLNPDSTNGHMTVAWFEGSVTPTSLPNGTNVFTMQFEVIGAPCDSSGVIISNTPLEIEIADENEMNVGADVINGYVTVPGTDCGTFNGLRITGSQEVASNGSQVCVQFTSEGFDNIGGAQYTINFNPAVLEFAGVQNINWPGVSEAGSFGTTGAADGEITFVWFDQNAVGVDLPDGTVLYELCFNVVGSGGQMSQISFGSDPLEIEISDGSGSIVNFEGVPGKVTVEGEVEGFALISQDGVMGALNETICIDVSVNDFIDIFSMQFSVNWDSTVLQYSHVEGFNLPDFNENNVAGPEAPGNNGAQMTVVWIDQALEGITLDNGTTIFSICFVVVGECEETTQIQFTDEPLEIEVSDVNNVVPVGQIPGTFTVTCGCGANIVTEVDPLCPGECSGAIDVTVFGCSEPITYAWSNGATTQDLT